jgi:hypothetical protein
LTVIGKYGVVAHDDAIDPADPTDTGNQAGTGRRVFVHAVGSKRREFEERRAGIEQPINPLPGQQFAAVLVFGARILTPTLGHQGNMRVQFVDERARGHGIGLEFGRARIEFGLDKRHWENDCFRPMFVAEQGVSTAKGRAAFRAPCEPDGTVSERFAVVKRSIILY